MPCSCEPINIAERGIRIGPAAPATDVVELLGNLVAWRWRSGVQSLAPRLPPCLVSARARRFGGSSSTCWGGLCGSSPSRRSRSALQRIAERWRCNRLAICEAEFVGHKVTSSRSPRRSNGTWRTSVVAAPAPGAMPADSCGTILAITLPSRRRSSEPLPNQRAPDNLSMRVIEFRVSAQWALGRMPLGENSAGEFLERRPRRIVA